MEQGTKVNVSKIAVRASVFGGDIGTATRRVDKNRYVDVDLAPLLGGIREFEYVPIEDYAPPYPVSFSLELSADRQVRWVRVDREFEGIVIGRVQKHEGRVEVGYNAGYYEPEWEPGFFARTRTIPFYEVLMPSYDNRLLKAQIALVYERDLSELS